MNIFVGNLGFSVTDHDLRQLFESYGAVDKVNIIPTATLDGVAQICPCRIAVLQLQATRASDL